MKKCSKKNSKVHRKPPVLESLFIKGASLTLLKRDSDRDVFL